MEESEGAPAEEGKEGTCGEEEKDGKDETRAEEEGAGEARVIVCSSRTYVSVIFFFARRAPKRRARVRRALSNFCVYSTDVSDFFSFFSFVSALLCFVGILHVLFVGGGSLQRRTVVSRRWMRAGRATAALKVGNPLRVCCLYKIYIYILLVLLIHGFTRSMRVCSPDLTGFTDFGGASPGLVFKGKAKAKGKKKK
jgi:hypothetical protein